jgi:hypothetical protein
MPTLPARADTPSCAQITAASTPPHTAIERHAELLTGGTRAPPVDQNGSSGAAPNTAIERITPPLSDRADAATVLAHCSAGASLHTTSLRVAPLLSRGTDALISGQKTAPGAYPLTLPKRAVPPLPLRTNATITLQEAATDAFLHASLLHVTPVLTLRTDTTVPLGDHPGRTLGLGGSGHAAFTLRIPLRPRPANTAAVFSNHASRALQLTRRRLGRHLFTPIRSGRPLRPLRTDTLAVLQNRPPGTSGLHWLRSRTGTPTTGHGPAPERH